MSDEELIEKLRQFGDYLNVGDLIIDVVRLIGWFLVKGVSFILDGIENIANDVLFIKTFFQNSEVVSFVDSMRPLFYILLAFSLLFAGYLLIFQKKFNREAMMINIFIAITIIALLSTGMEKVNEFTDEAIDAIGSQQLFDEEEGTISQNIMSRNITDLIEFDNNDWETTELDKPNSIPLKDISRISITEKLNKDNQELSSNGVDISENTYMYYNGEYQVVELAQGKLDLIKEHYYRFDVNWISLIATLIIMAFTLISISYKLARLSFEMTFNYVLANIIAPIDVHDGQKTKKILTSIFNTFFSIILIFLSMKIYIIGTGWLADELSGIAYLITLIAFSVAVIDGPNIVEKLFGIDAGLKSGLGMMMGAYGGAKMATGASKFVKNKMSGGKGKTGGKGSNDKSPNDNDNKKTSNDSEDEAPSPNDEKSSQDKEKGDKDKQQKQEKENQKTEDDKKSPSPNDEKSSQDREKDQKEEKENQKTEGDKKAPSPNDEKQKSSGTGRTGGQQQKPSGTDGTGGQQQKSSGTGGTGGQQQKSSGTDGTGGQQQKRQQRQTNNVETEIIVDTEEKVEHKQGSHSSTTSGTGGTGGQQQKSFGGGGTTSRSSSTQTDTHEHEHTTRKQDHTKTREEYQKRRSSRYTTGKNQRNRRKRK